MQTLITVQITNFQTDRTETDQESEKIRKQKQKQIGLEILQEYYLQKIDT